MESNQQTPDSSIQNDKIDYRNIHLIRTETFINEFPCDPLTPIPDTQNPKQETPPNPQTTTKPKPSLNIKSPRIIYALYSITKPEEQPSPKLLITSLSACDLINVDNASLTDAKNLNLLSGAELHDQCVPYALNYAGHQFGIYAGQLGDGRCISIGEIPAANTRAEITTQRYTLQLKGVGPTPFSRGGDGYATLRSCVVEFLMSEYLVAIGIPTTRCLSVVSTERKVYRGGSIKIPCGVLTRLARSWIRFGSFELFHYRNDMDNVKKLADYCIWQFYPFAIDEEHKQTFQTSKLLAPDVAISKGDEQGTIIVKLAPNYTLDKESNVIQADLDLTTPPTPKAVSIPLNRYGIFFREVVKRTAKLVARWQAYGYVHGCLNTDHMSILGLTLHHGSCGWMDSYDPEWTPNASDVEGRYRFEMQPLMAQWNLSRLGNTMADLIGQPYIAHAKAPKSYETNWNPEKASEFVKQLNEMQIKNAPGLPSPKRTLLGMFFNSNHGENIVRELVGEFETLFIAELETIMSQKLGFQNQRESDFQEFVIPLLELMAEVGADYTLFFRSLSTFKIADPIFSIMVTYNAERHTEAALNRYGESWTMDPLSLLLKSLFTLIKMEREIHLNPAPTEPPTNTKDAGKSTDHDKSNIPPVSPNMNKNLGLGKTDSMSTLNRTKKSELAESSKALSGSLAALSKGTKKAGDISDQEGSDSEETGRLSSSKDDGGLNKSLSRSQALLSSLETLSAGRKRQEHNLMQEKMRKEAQRLAREAIIKQSLEDMEKQKVEQKSRVDANRKEATMSKAKYVSVLAKPTDIANKWRTWAIGYRNRLVDEIPIAQRTGKSSLETEDMLRSKRMKLVNPRYILRGWIVRDMINKAEGNDIVFEKARSVTGSQELVQVKGASTLKLNSTPTSSTTDLKSLSSKNTGTQASNLGLSSPSKTNVSQLSAGVHSASKTKINLNTPSAAKSSSLNLAAVTNAASTTNLQSTKGNTTNSNAADVKSQPAKPETCTQSLEQVIRVLVGDIWGEKAESSDGLTNESDKSAASKWVCEPPPKLNNMSLYIA